MMGLGHHGAELTDTQAKSGLPMPSTTSHVYSNARLLELIEKKEEKERQIDALTLALQQADVVKKLSVEDQRLMQELYHSKRSAQQVAEQNGYSIKGLYKHISVAIGKAL